MITMKRDEMGPYQWAALSKSNTGEWVVEWRPAYMRKTRRRVLKTATGAENTYRRALHEIVSLRGVA